MRDRVWGVRGGGGGGGGGCPRECSLEVVCSETARFWWQMLYLAYNSSNLLTTTPFSKGVNMDTCSLHGVAEIQQ